MSILDESFPNDEFLDKLDFTPNTDRCRYQFPHNRREQLKQQQQQYQQLLQGEIKTTAATTTTTTTSQSNTTNHSTSSSSSSTSSLNDHHNNIFSDDGTINHKRTTKSEPNGSADNVSKKSHELTQSHNRAVSYQDIHNEYTKRRYKHVESKVGQYIANMKAEDKKRRNSTKFQRHRSMPETLSDQSVLAAAEIAARHDEMHSSVAELNKLNESAGTSGADADADSSENMTGTSSSSRARHETSDEASGPTTDFINKLAYAQLLDEKERTQSHCDYLQTRLDEKISENMRLKRNVDFMRIELSNCKDKLQKQMSLGSYYNGSSCTLGRQSMHAYLCSQAKSSKATQTEFVTPIAPPPPPGILTRDLFSITPNTPDANNNRFESSGAGTSTAAAPAAAADGNVAMSDIKCKSGKTMATIQPLSLNFSNLGESDSGEPQANIESASPQKLKPTSDSCRRQERREEFIYYDKRSGVETLNDSANVYVENNKTEDVSSTELIASGDRNNKHTKKHNSLRRRWLRLFGPCTRCKDHNLTLDGAHIGADNDDGSHRLEQAYTQIPLLEKSFLNHCRNLR